MILKEIFLYSAQLTLFVRIFTSCVINWFLLDCGIASRRRFERRTFIRCCELSVTLHAVKTWRLCRAGVHKRRTAWSMVFTYQSHIGGTVAGLVHLHLLLEGRASVLFTFLAGALTGLRLNLYGITAYKTRENIPLDKNAYSFWKQN